MPTSVLQRVHPIMFAGITEMIGKSAIKTKGGSKPSAMDADGWKRILCLNNFGDTNLDLRKAIANLSRRPVQGKYQSLPSKHWLYADSFLLKKFKFTSNRGWRNSPQNQRKRHFVST